MRPWHGHFEGKKGAPDAAASANALRLVRAWLKDPRSAADIIVLQRDTDTQPERREGLEQGRGAVPLTVPVALGVASPKVEAWAICAFGPNTDQEREM